MYGGCQWPYINKGWFLDGSEPDNSDAVLGDCSITYAQAAGSPYMIRMVVYSIISAAAGYFCIKNQKEFRTKRLASKKKEEFSLAEKLNYYNSCNVVCHTLSSLLDPLAYDNVLPRALQSFLQAVCALVLFCTVLALIRSWIAIADGGKTSQGKRLKHSDLLQSFHY